MDWLALVRLDWANLKAALPVIHVRRPRSEAEPMDADRSHSWFAPRAAQFPLSAEMAGEFARRKSHSHFDCTNGAPFENSWGR
ncbi:MAG: hypothetical protein K0R01_2239 [Mycobacterium sp.]|jgi:hypothetical protein|nr:hypothetical protein [Mycobacterium sp.]